MEWAYVAGFLDADGSIILVHRKRGKDKGQIEPRITFSNSNKEVILALADFFGLKGHVYKRRQNATWFYRQPQYYLQFGGFKRVKRVLENCLPHLIVKRDIAGLVLRFVTSRLPKIGSRQHYSEEEWNILKQVRSLRGRKGWQNRLKESQHPENDAHS